MLRHLKIIIWLLLTSVSSCQILKAESIAKTELKIYSIPDYCGSEVEKEFVIALTIGKVISTDSLFGFNFQLRYDTNKIDLDDALFISTLSENCNFHQGGSGDAGTFLGSAMVYGLVPLVGDLPLMAIQGKILSSCIDSTTITLDFLAFTKEFTRDSIELSEIKINIDKIDNQQRYLNIKFDRDTIKSNEDSIVNVSIEKNNNYYLNNPICYIKANAEMIDLSSIKTISNNVLIDNIKSIGDSIEIKLIGDKIQDGALFQFEVNNSSKLESNIEISIVPGFCDCFSKYYNDTITYKYVKNPDTTISVNETKHYYLNYNKNVLKIEDISNIKRIKIYNIYGAIKKEIDNQYSNDIEINFEEFENGVYGILLEGDNTYDNNIEKRILVIKN